MTKEQFYTQRYALVRAGFIAQHTTLNQYCIKHRIHRQNARDALLGIWNGDAGKKMAENLVEASGAKVDNFEEAVVNQSCQPDSLVDNS